MHVFSETVEKPQKLIFRASKYLILLLPNLGKLQKLDFFDSLSIYHHLPQHWDFYQINIFFLTDLSVFKYKIVTRTLAEAHFHT